MSEMRFGCRIFAFKTRDMKRALLLCCLLAPLFVFSQCLTGVLSVSGPGCGCLSSCDLTPYGGPDCEAGVTGNCDVPGTQIAMSFILDLEPTCEVTVEARMSPRPGCSASGADSGDAIRVRDLTGGGAWVTGTSNASLFDAHTQTGGQVVIEGSANRADEIITYEVYYASGFCPFCLLLPVELLEFNAHAEGMSVYLDWLTATESNNKGFEIQLSRSGESFSSVGFVEGNGTTLLEQQYNFNVELPSPGLWYLRLAQIDHDETVTYSPVLAVRAEARDAFMIRRSANGLSIQSQLANLTVTSVEVFDTSGRLRLKEEHVFEAYETKKWQLTAGLHFVRVHLASGEVVTGRIIR